VKLVRAYWSGTTPRLASIALTAVTAPLSVLFGAGVRTRNFAYDRGVFRVEDPPIPVLSVGNLTVGGTGKTPVSGWLLAFLREAGAHPALVTRGFGEDEVLLHRRWHPDLPVIEAPHRMEGVRQAADGGADIVVVDDGFQHRKMGRTVDIVLLSPAQPLPARLLPRGPWREPLANLERADLVLVTAKTSREREEALELLEQLRARRRLPRAHLLAFRPGPWADLAGSPAAPPEGPLLAPTSIAEPDAFIELVARRSGSPVVEPLPFPDHHPYTPDDLEHILERAGDRMVVTTEKDAVKLLPLTGASAPRFRVLPIEPAPTPALESALHALLARATAGAVQ
jgi:tetraacyldisaccharide 4'-kinase